MKLRYSWITIIFLMLMTFSVLAETSVDYFSYYFGNYPQPEFVFQQNDPSDAKPLNITSSIGKKSPQKAFLFSAVVPGTGEFYSGTKRGVFFVASEIALWTAYFMLHGKAEDYQDDYVKFVDAHIRFEEDSPADSTKSWTLEDYEHATQADNWHYVYTETNGKPIERVGKFYWDDLPKDKIDEPGGVSLDESNSESRKAAFEKRGLANDEFKQAKIFLGLVVVNHIASAVDARIAATMYNNRVSNNGINVSLHPTLSASGNPGMYVKLQSVISNK